MDLFSIWDHRFYPLANLQSDWLWADCFKVETKRKRNNTHPSLLEYHETANWTHDLIRARCRNIRIVCTMTFPLAKSLLTNSARSYRTIIEQNLWELFRTLYGEGIGARIFFSGTVCYQNLWKLFRTLYAEGSSDGSLQGYSLWWVGESISQSREP